jgi:large subunit ribosomal protein L24
MARIKKNDLVQVIAGQDKGKRGTVIEICSRTSRVKVKGVSLRICHVKKRKDGDVAGIKQAEGFIDASNVMPICHSTNKPCRVNAKLLDDGTKKRVSNRSREAL